MRPTIGVGKRTARDDSDSQMEPELIQRGRCSRFRPSFLNTSSVNALFIRSDEELLAVLTALATINIVSKFLRGLLPVWIHE